MLSDKERSALLDVARRYRPRSTEPWWAPYLLLIVLGLATVLLVLLTLCLLLPGDEVMI
jgi:hypothetical protein